MAPYYTRSKEVWYNGDGVIVSKHEIDHEVSFKKIDIKCENTFSGTFIMIENNRVFDQNSKYIFIY